MFRLCHTINEVEIKGFNNIYYFEFGKHFTHTPEKHSFWELVYVDSGRVLAIVDENSCLLEQGQMIFHEPNEVHSHISDSKSPNNMLVISFTCNSPIMKFFRKKIFTADKTTRTLLSLFIDEAKKALGNIPSEYNNKGDLDFSHSAFGSSQLLLCYFTELLINIVRNNSDTDNKIVSSEESRATAQNSMCELIKIYMQDNLYSALTLNDICSHFMLGKSQLSHIFKANSGKSVMAYYNSLKFAEAKRLLRSSQVSINQISDMLGFSCIHSFSRAFKNSVGTSPTEYKKRIL